jgi:hypothetical protein
MRSVRAGPPVAAAMVILSFALNEAKTTATTRSHGGRSRAKKNKALCSRCQHLRGLNQLIAPAATSGPAAHPRRATETVLFCACSQSQRKTHYPELPKGG